MSGERIEQLPAEELFKETAQRIIENLDNGEKSFSMDGYVLSIDEIGEQGSLITLVDHSEQNERDGSGMPISGSESVVTALRFRGRIKDVHISGDKGEEMLTSFLNKLGESV